MGYTHSLRTPSSVSDTATAVRVLYHKPGGFVKDKVSDFVAEGRKMSFGHFSILCPARTAHKGAQTPPLCEFPADVRGTRA